MIEVSNICFKYPGSKRPVFTDFSVSMAPGRVYGLLGKNGTGKSTLLYLMAGLLRPRSGSVCVDGVEASKRRADMLREMFVVPEEFFLPDVTLDAYVRINAPFYPRFSREVLDACLADFELPGRLRLGKLSMGQKKKVYMSFALAAGTRLVLMDEPTNGLDIPSKSIFRRVVRAIHRRPHVRHIHPPGARRGATDRPSAHHIHRRYVARRLGGRRVRALFV